MARPSKHDGVVYRRDGTQFWWMRYRDRSGKRRQEPTGTADWDEAQKRLRERLQARDEDILEIVRKGEHLTFAEWAEFFLENYSKPPMRMPKTHAANMRAMKHLKAAFGSRNLASVSADDVEIYLRRRLQQRVKWKTGSGVIEGDPLKPATVHQELRVLRRVLSVAVRKKLLASNPCSGVEFPVKVKGLFRPHYMSWSEQQRIESHAPQYLRNVIRIITETGLRIYKELTPMKIDQLDLANAVVWIPDSKTPSGIAEAPLTDLALAAFRDQMSIAGPGTYLFPSDENPSGHQITFKTTWAATLRRAKVPHFRIGSMYFTQTTEKP